MENFILFKKLGGGRGLSQEINLEEIKSEKEGIPVINVVGTFKMYRGKGDETILVPGTYTPHKNWTEV